MACIFRDPLKTIYTNSCSDTIDTYLSMVVIAVNRVRVRVRVRV